MEKYGNKVKVYNLQGSNEKENINQRITFLTTLLNNAERKVNYIGELRQKNMNYALITFAGLFTIGLSLPSELYSLFVSFVLFAIMAVFCLLDRRYHKFIHGWRKSVKTFMDKISEVINNPVKDITFPRYAVDGEKEAEIFIFQPVIFYFLVLGGFFHFLYSFINWLKA